MKWKPISEAPLNRRWWILWDCENLEPIVTSKQADDGTFHWGDWEGEIFASHFLDVDPPEVEAG